MNKEVSVEQRDALAKDAGYINFESMRQCADAWIALTKELHVIAPGWINTSGTALDCAIAALRSAEAGAEQHGAQEAVAWIENSEIGRVLEWRDGFVPFVQSNPVGTKLYTTPQPAVDVGSIVRLSDELSSYAVDCLNGRDYEFLIDASKRLAILASAQGAGK